VSPFVSKEVITLKFFSPTGVLKELLLLEYIESNENCTQKELAKVIDAAVSMVNVYINDLEEKGFLIRDYQSAKVVYYRITAEGIKRKNYLVISHMRELLDLYQLAKGNVGKFLNDLESKGYKDILLYGAGEVAETIIGVIRDKELSNLEIIAIVDDNVEKQGKEMLGYKIIPTEKINMYKHDAIVITSYTFEEDINKRLEEVGYSMEKVVRCFGVKE